GTVIHRWRIELQMSTLPAVFKRIDSLIASGSPNGVLPIEAAFAPYIKVAEKAPLAVKGRAKTPTATKASGSGRSVEQLKAIRVWAGKNGFDVSVRGRIKTEVIDAFDAAH
uniref:Lsr2 family DNA-binding protein n=1 Tax=Rhodococcus globerulus TaxID=33008 RepID=UPI003AFAAE87